MTHRRSKLAMPLLVFASISAGTPSALKAQTHTACRVPDVGAIYMIGTAGTPTDCLDASHVQFSWTGSAEIPDGGVGASELGLTRRSTTNSYSVSSWAQVMSCAAGEVAISGGYEVTDVVGGDPDDLIVTTNGPFDETGWIVRMRWAATPTSWTLTHRVVCIRANGA